MIYIIKIRKILFKYDTDGGVVWCSCKADIQYAEATILESLVWGCYLEVRKLKMTLSFCS